jgi:serine/threonine protein phosphatase 1
LLCEEHFGKVIVHGHSPVKEPDIRPNRINIDTGAYATGRLTCLVLEGDGMRFL